MSIVFFVENTESKVYLEYLDMDSLGAFAPFASFSELLPVSVAQIVQISGFVIDCSTHEQHSTVVAPVKSNPGFTRVLGY